MFLLDTMVISEETKRNPNELATNYGISSASTVRT